jgi:hypothetical protein
MSARRASALPSGLAVRRLLRAGLAVGRSIPRRRHAAAHRICLQPGAHAYARELPTIGAHAVTQRAQLERELAETEGRLDRQLDLYETNVITKAKLKERIDDLETRAAAIKRELAESEAPTTYTLHPRAADRYRELVGRLHVALADDVAQAAREAFRGLPDRVVFVPGKWERPIPARASRPARGPSGASENQNPTGHDSLWGNGGCGDAQPTLA